MGKKLEKRRDKRVLEYVVEEKKHPRTGKRRKVPRKGVTPKLALWAQDRFGQAQKRPSTLLKREGAAEVPRRGNSKGRGLGRENP